MSSQRNFPGEHMYGGRSGRPVEARDGIPVSHLSLVSRRQSVYGVDDNSRSRGKSTVEEDSRVGNRTELRVSSFLGGGKARGSIDRADHRADGSSSYASMPDRRGAFRDDGMLKIERGIDESPLRGEGSGRFREGSSRAERSLRSAAAYADEPKWIRNGNYDSLSYEGGTGSLRDSDYLAAKSSSSISPVLPGFILECSKRMIMDFFSQKGTFVLPFDDRRLVEQVGRGTKIFLMDVNVRELHGVFQADSYATIDIDASSLRAPPRVRVRVAKECIPLTERQFKDIIHENYYSNSKFTDGLTKDQVMKLLQIFRPVDPERHGHLSLPSSRRALDSSLPQSSPEFQSLQDEIVYRKEERWRRGGGEGRSLSSHSYHAQDTGRLLSKLPVHSHSKELDEYVVYADDEVIEDIPLNSSRLVASSNLYSNSRGKQQSMRNQPGSRTGTNQTVGNVGHNELKLTDGDWRDEIDPRVSVYRKRRPVSISPMDDLSRDRSVSPWKDVLTRADQSGGEIYVRSGKGPYKEELSYLSRRPRRSDIDLNLPLEIGHGEPLHLHDIDSKVSRRKVWEIEDAKRYSISPPKGRTIFHRSSSLQLSDHLLPSTLDDHYDDQRLDSRHMVNLNQKDYPLLRTEDKSRTLSSSYSNGKFGKQQRTVPVGKSHSRDKLVTSPGLRKRPVIVRDMYSKDSVLRGSKVPPVKFKANLPHARGKPERVVTLINSQPRLDGVLDRDGLRAWKIPNTNDYGRGRDNGQIRKRKASVWSRIALPGKSLGQRGLPAQGRGRVFSRLGPSTREESNVYKKRKWSGMDRDSERFDNVEESPDALEGEDYLHDDSEALEVDKEEGKTADDLQGWTRKKTLALPDNAGQGSSTPGDYLHAQGGCNSQNASNENALNAKRVRRKLVRPSIGPRGQAVDSGWKHLGSSSIVPGEDSERNVARLQGSSDSMDMEMTNLEIQDGEMDSPLGSQLDLNSADEDDHPDFKETAVSL